MKLNVTLSLALIAQASFAGGLVTKKAAAKTPSHRTMEEAEINALADDAYSFYVETMKAALHGGTVNQAEFEPSRLEKIYASLDELGVHVDAHKTGVGFVQPAIQFARRIKAKLSNPKQVIADLAITDATLKEEVAAAIETENAYFSALEFFHLEPVYLHTWMKDAIDKKEVKEKMAIDTVTTDLVNHLMSPFTEWRGGMEAVVTAFNSSEKYEQKFNDFKKSPTIQGIVADLAKANELSATPAQAERAARNVRFFMYLLTAKMRDASKMVRDFGIEDAEVEGHCRWICANFEATHVLRALGFELY